MNVVGMALDAANGLPGLVACAVVIGVPVLTLLAVAAHLAMKPVRKTRVGKWAGDRAEVRMGRVRAAFTARKRTKAGAP